MKKFAVLSLVLALTLTMSLFFFNNPVKAEMLDPDTLPATWLDTAYLTQCFNACGLEEPCFEAHWTAKDGLVEVTLKGITASGKLLAAALPVEYFHWDGTGIDEPVLINPEGFRWMQEYCIQHKDLWQ